MCIVSNVTDYWREKPGYGYPTPQPAPFTVPLDYRWTAKAWEAYQELLRKAAEVDALTDQPDCEDPAKQAWIEAVQDHIDSLSDDNLDGGYYTDALSDGGTYSEHYVDANGNPAGGITEGTGFHVRWQNGPLNRGAERLEPNGAFVEEIIWTAIDRIEFYQDSQFHGIHNAVALGHLRAALEVLTERTRDREDRQVEGTHQK